MLRQFDPFGDLNWALNPAYRSASAPSPSPAVPMDAIRGDHGVTLRFDLPGVAPDDVELTIEKNELTLEAERREHLAEGEQYLTHERPTGSFRRTLYLGDSLDPEGVEARWDNGVLVIHVPVAEAAKPRKVSIGAGATETSAVEASSA